MIQRVEIDQFALADHIGIDFRPGLTVLSGETGAGKSILIDALDFAVGGRADRSMVRSGSDEMSVSVQFGAEGREDNADHRDGMLISRTFRPSGRGYARLDGRLVTAGELRDASVPLIAIHSQSDQQSIFRESVHQELLDSFGGPSSADALDRYHRFYLAFSAVERRLEALHLDPETRARRREILAYQLQEIDGASLSPGEEEALLKKIKTLTAVHDIAGNIRRAAGALDSEDDLSASGYLKRAAAELSEAGRHSTRLQEMAGRAAHLQDMLRELVSDLTRLSDKMEDRPDELERANQRLVFLRRLQEKYGQDLEHVLAYGEKAREEIRKLDDTETELVQLTEERGHLIRSLLEAEDQLFCERRMAADRLAQAVNRELSDLNMAGSSFGVEIARTPASEDHVPENPHQISFMIAPNPGEPPMPLISIISGGEASRVLLAIKTVLASVDRVSTLIFDEIDTGISGRTTTMIARKLDAIARHVQVLCVTHSAQIAAAANDHLLVGKTESGGRAITTVTRITGEQRVAEIARLLTGRPDDPHSRELAADLISARSYI